VLNINWKSYFFSHITIAYAIGAVGFVSSITTVFLDTSATLSIKYFLFLICISLIFIIILFKIINDLINNDNHQSIKGDAPISFNEQSNIFVVRNTPFYRNKVVYFVYVEEALAERLAYIVSHFYEQEKVIQLKVLKDFNVFSTPPKESETLSRLIIKDKLSVNLLDDISFDTNE
jgi:hypothetical protein